MTRIVQLRRRLDDPCDLPAWKGLRVYTFRGPEDMGRWLALRHEAFDMPGGGGRQWIAADFEREFLQKPDWSPERMWLAELLAPEEDKRIEVASSIAGSVYLGFRGTGPTATGVIHWLMVAAGARRRGIGRLLVATLEAECWRRGVRQVSCETRADWTAATAFYKSLGYA